MLIRKNKKKYRPPTEDEFLRYVPKRAELEWSINEDGIVEKPFFLWLRGFATKRSIKKKYSDYSNRVLLAEIFSFFLPNFFLQIKYKFMNSI